VWVDGTIQCGSCHGLVGRFHLIVAVPPRLTIPQARKTATDCLRPPTQPASPIKCYCAQTATHGCIQCTGKVKVKVAECLSVVAELFCAVCYRWGWCGRNNTHCDPTMGCTAAYGTCSAASKRVLGLPLYTLGAVLAAWHCCLCRASSHSFG
jgi:hypothetical protein